MEARLLFVAPPPNTHVGIVDVVFFVSVLLVLLLRLLTLLLVLLLSLLLVLFLKLVRVL